MPRGKKNSTTNTASKAASKSVAEPIKEKAAASETKSVKPTAKKKAAAPKKAAAAKSSAKTRTVKKTATSATVVETGVLKSAVDENAEKEAKKSTVKTAKKAASKTTKKATTNSAKKTSAAATGVKKPAVKKTAKCKSDEVLIQSSGKDYTLSEITELCKNDYRGGTRKQIKSIKVYVKAEGDRLKAYYVVNDNISGSVDL